MQRCSSAIHGLKAHLHFVLGLLGGSSIVGMLHLRRAMGAQDGGGMLHLRMPAREYAKEWITWILPLPDEGKPLDWT